MAMAQRFTLSANSRIAEAAAVRSNKWDSASSFPSSSGAPASEILPPPSGRRTGSHGTILTLRRRRRRISVQIAAAREGGENPLEAVSERLSVDEFEKQHGKGGGGREEEEPLESAGPERWSLEELDEQLKVLASREILASRRLDSSLEQNVVKGELPPLQWPALTDGFFLYTAIGLFLLTIVSNVLFTTFLGPTAVGRDSTFETTVVQLPRYRVTTLQEEREAREAKAAAKEAAEKEAVESQSREAPLP